MEDDGRGTGLLLDDQVDLTGNNGVLKRTLRRGVDAGRHPSHGHEVDVHYTGRFADGTQFDSSRDRNDGGPFQFRLGQGHVIKAWEIGVATMEKGEKAEFTCSPAYAYGEEGNPPHIPGGATVVFEIELFDWTEAVDLSPKEDGKIIKYFIQEGKGYYSPKDDALVQVKITSYREDNSIFEKSDKLEYNVGSSGRAGLDIAIASMKKGEHSKFMVDSSFAFGETGSKEFGVDPDESVLYDIELLDFEREKESWLMDKKERLQVATTKKNEGNEFFKSRSLKSAEKKYKQVLQLYDREEEALDPDETSIKATALLNLAACAIERLSFAEGLTFCNKALDIEPSNGKAYFRRGKCSMNLGDLGAADADLKRASAISPSDAAIRKERETLRKLIAVADSKDKQTYKGMFERMAKMEEKEIPKSRREEERRSLLRVPIIGWGIPLNESQIDRFSIMLFSMLIINLYSMSAFGWSESGPTLYASSAICIASICFLQSHRFKRKLKNS